MNRSRFLDDFERVNREVPYADLRWFLDHAETVTARNLERIKALGGGVAVQHRMAFQPERNRLGRVEALRLYTVGSSWFSGEDGKKGAIVTGQLADLAVLSEDYFSIPEDRIKHLDSVLTIVGGKPVYATAEFKHLDPPPLPVSPDWSPVQHYGGYGGIIAHQRQDMLPLEVCTHTPWGIHIGCVLRCSGPASAATVSRSDHAAVHCSVLCSPGRIASAESIPRKQRV
jgi:hypothetical protein